MRARVDGRTFTEQGRRAQIVAAAISTIAEIGYPQTSFARIAKRAGLSSTGMISYHFAGKDDLMRAVVDEVTRMAVEYIQPRIRAVTGHAAMLRARIEANVELFGQRPDDMRALVEIMSNAKTDDGRPIAGSDAVTDSERLIEQHLRAGQQAGEFGEFDPWVMALAIQGSIDALIGRSVAGGPDDFAAMGRELADLFERATRP